MTETERPAYPHAELTRAIIGAAYEVHKHLGHGFLESVYVNALMLELAACGLQAVAQAPLEVTYKGTIVGMYFADIVVEGNVICELKAVRTLAPEHEAQLLNYLKGTGIKVGLLLNFGATGVQVKRMVF
jgi:GxxExxY protein